MTTYQDIIDYLNKHYLGEFTLVKQDGYYTITNGEDSISIYKNYYKNQVYIDTKLSHLLADLLDTPVDQRNKPEIKHTIKPVTKESAYANNLTSADAVYRSYHGYTLSIKDK